MSKKDAGQMFLEILNKLEEEEKIKKDIVAPINSVRVNPDFTFESEDMGKVKMTDHAFGQLCSNAYNYPLPADYFRNLHKEDPERFSEQLNYHLNNGRGVTRKFRLTGDEVRGIVTESYIPYDNLDALRIFQDSTRNLHEFELQKSHFDDKLMFLRFTFPETERNFGLTVDHSDDRNFVAIDLVNSEVGGASLIANPSIYRLVCTNGMVAKQAEFGFFKQRHIHVDPMVVNENLRKSIIHGIENGGQLLHMFEQARKVKIDNPYEFIEARGKARAFSEKMIRTVKENYDIEAEKSLFGVVNSFTRTARDIKSIERRLDIEKYASKIMEDGLKKLTV